ncbi:hypothetical protein LTS17_007443 [Exophiala oligosperma]
MLTCYNNCPNDPGVGTVQQQKEQNCNAASVYGTTTTLGTASSTSGSTSATLTESSAETAVHTGFASASETGASASGSATGSSSNDNAAIGMEVGKSLVVLAIAGVGLIL